MVQESDISNLISIWEQRLSNTLYSNDYKIAIKECLFDLKKVLDTPKTYEEFIDSIVANLPSEEVEEYLREQEADSYLSSIEAHEEAV